MDVRRKLVASAALAAFSAPSWAQQQSDEIEVVKVTAQKRKEDPAKVAMSITAVTGAQLQAEHVNDITDLTRVVPNISFTAASGNGGAGPGTSNIEIRGISSTAGAATVGMYLGETPITVGNVYTMGNIEPRFFDIDRVEVLRGPQATLYGASSMGGTIKFVPVEPDLKEREFSTYTEASNTKGGSPSYSGNVIGNFPLIPDELALRIGVQAQHTGGYINQVDNDGNLLARNINQMSDQELRAALKWKPTRTLTISPSVYFQRVDAKDIDAFNLDMPLYQARKVVREPSIDKLLTPSVTINWDMGGADLTSTTSYFERKFDRQQNGSEYSSYAMSSDLTSIENGGKAPQALIDAVVALPSVVYLNNQVRQVAQEFRVASHPYDEKVSPWTWLVGTYFSNQHTNITEDDPIPGITATFASFGFDIADPTLLPDAAPGQFPHDSVYAGIFHYREKQGSVFGELNYYFSPTVHATFGARYLKAKSTLSQINSNYGAGPGDNSSADISAHAFTPKYALTWEVDPANTVYTSVSKGFRLGGANVYVPSVTCAGDLQDQGLTDAPIAYAPDSLWSYEVGSKSRFLNNHVSLNADVFYVKWKNIQQAVYMPNCGYTYNANAGNATTKGFEFDIKAKPMPGLTLSLSAGYVKAVLSDDSGIANGVVGAVAGARIQGVPNYNAALNATYNFSAWDMPAFVMGGMQWVGSSRGTLDPDQTDYERPGYHTNDFSTGLTMGAYTFTAFVKNAFDTKTIIQHPQVASIVQGYRLTPRSIGVSLATKF
ncbi:TonB-dependent receptor [Duganella sp. FT80W]|uniref:TonB-dependent receptor n=1 Tax=Duganella guangzhouensis TaxID=2666084 RepID=A0A6I2KYF5_9BURK|nr:TonB-dependent receptor [Duganella guangzhouensis]MRW89236.1 TonB-dependent receptor [Duganella guangzhouensis]